jgi:hypothetical protein
MGFFTPRERAELGKPDEMTGLVRQEFAPRARRPAEPDISGHVGTVVNGVAASCVQEIDDLFVKLQRRRQQLLDESARVQREILEYAALCQSTMQSTKIISESLTQFNNVPDAPAAEQRNGAGEPPGRHAANEGASSDKAKDAAGRRDRPSETA